MMSHILNSCHADKRMYIAFHDTTVKLIAKDISNCHHVHIHVMFHLCNSNPGDFSHLSAITPDVVVFVLKVAGTVDSSPEEAFMTTVIKYQPLLNTISELSYTHRTHRLVVRGLQQLGMLKRGLQSTAVSAIISSRHIWWTGCYLYR